VLSVYLRFTDSDYPFWYLQTLHKWQVRQSIMYQFWNDSDQNSATKGFLRCC